MKTFRLPSGEPLPQLGLGTWMLAEHPEYRAQEIAALRRGLDLGISLIDTAEMYGEGASEALVGEAITGRRDEVFLVTKVYPFNASLKAMPNACDKSLSRLGVECIDLYLLHWRGNVLLSETVEAFERLQSAGKIRYWGVSNFDVADMEKLAAIPGGEKCSVNQVLYNLSRRGIEWDLKSWCAARGIPVMAYSPLEQARLLKHPGLRDLAARCNRTPAQLALAWLLQQDGIVAIPKASDPIRVEENFRALAIELEPEVTHALDQLFPPPRGPRPLEML